MDTNPGGISQKSIIILLISILHLDLYTKLCTIEVDLSHLQNTSDVHTFGTGSEVHYVVYYDLVMLFGGTEIEAQLCWKEKVRSKKNSKIWLMLCCHETDYYANCFFLYTFRVSRRGIFFSSSILSGSTF